MPRALVALALAACSFEHGRVPGTNGDGGNTTSDGSGSGDDGGGPGSDSTVQLGPWGTPQLITTVNDGVAYDDDPTITGDLLELYFDSNREGNNADIWRSTRTAANQPWGAPTKVTELSTGALEGEPEIAADGLTIWFGRFGTNDWDVYISTRTSRASPWSTPTEVSEVNSTATDFHLSPTTAQTYALMNSNRPTATGDYDVYVTTRATATGLWSNPAPVSELNTNAHDANVNLSGDGLTVYFDSERTNNRDLYIARRSQLTAAFGTPQRIVELASGGRDSDPAVSADERYMVFASDRSGNMQLYESSR